MHFPPLLFFLEGPSSTCSYGGTFTGELVLFMRVLLFHIVAKCDSCIVRIRKYQELFKKMCCIRSCLWYFYCCTSTTAAETQMVGLIIYGISHESQNKHCNMKPQLPSHAGSLPLFYSLLKGFLIHWVRIAKYNITFMCSIFFLKLVYTV